MGGLVAIVMLVLTFSGIKSTEVDNFPFIIKFPILLISLVGFLGLYLIPFNDFLGPDGNFVLAMISSFVFYFPVGLFIGWLYGKIKNRKAKKTPNV